MFKVIIDNYKGLTYGSMEYDKWNAGENVPNPKTLGAFLGHFLGVSGPGSTTIVLLIKFCNFHEKFGQDPSWPREHCPRSAA